MPILKKTKTAKKAQKTTKKATRALVKAKLQANSKPTKNPAAYFQCLSACCQKGISPKRISQVAHECKTNALTINAQMSAQKTKAVQKIKEGYAELGKGLSELIKASK